MPFFFVQPVKLAVPNPDEDGMLVFADERLIAILSRLLDDFHGDLKGAWFIEAGFGPCDPSLAPSAFRLPSEALRWIAAQAGTEARVTSAELIDIDQRLGAE